MFSLIVYILTAAVGFMMGFLYRKSQTSAQLFEIDSKKTLKVFTAVLAAAVVVTFLLSYFTTNALVTTSIPEEGTIRFNNMKSMMVFSINFWFFALVVIANVYSQSLKKFAPVPYVLAFFFYALFILKDAYYINDYYMLWQKSLQLIKGDIPNFTQTAWTKCFFSLIATSFNALMIWWGLRK